MKVQTLTRRRTNSPPKPWSVRTQSQDRNGQLSIHWDPFNASVTLGQRIPITFLLRSIKCISCALRNPRQTSSIDNNNPFLSPCLTFLPTTILTRRSSYSSTLSGDYLRSDRVPNASLSLHSYLSISLCTSPFRDGVHVASYGQEPGPVTHLFGGYGRGDEEGVESHRVRWSTRFLEPQ